MERLDRKRVRRTTTRHQSAKVSNMTKDELREMIEASVGHQLVEWFGDPADLRDEQEWAHQFARSQDTLNRLADEALEKWRQGKTEPIPQGVLSARKREVCDRDIFLPDARTKSVCARK